MPKAVDTIALQSCRPSRKKGFVEDGNAKSGRHHRTSELSTFKEEMFC
jgi:hypothetical protein